MNKTVKILSIILLGLSFPRFQKHGYAQAQQKTPAEWVNRMIGTAGDGNIVPAVSVPFGMVQLAPDTRNHGPGYKYYDGRIIAFSHVHKSGGGCNDFLDIRFMPLHRGWIQPGASSLPDKDISYAFSHEKEEAAVGYYRVDFDDYPIRAELYATDRTGMQTYTWKEKGTKSMLIDLAYGSVAACTIVPQDDYDTVKTAFIEQVDRFTVRGYRISNGWSPEQHVYFYTRFSQPIRRFEVYSHNNLQPGVKKLESRQLKAVIYFDESAQTVQMKTGLSAVDMEGARKNLLAEMPGWDFASVRKVAVERWNTELSKIQIETNDAKQREIFYTALYNTLLYPMLYSDVDGRFRGPDMNIHHADGFNYYGQVMGLWDTFRGANPLLTLLAPQVMNDYVQTFLAYYKIAGQLPIWVLAGADTYQMLGLHAVAVIADCYFKGIRNYDAELAWEAMKTTAMRDTTGFSMRYFVGLKNYKKYGYVPADLEMEAVARTLEYAYNDWNIAQMARMLGKLHDYQYFLRRAASYRKVFDSTTHFMRGRMADGSWRTPFDPYASNHRRDDYCEGNAWQWTFFVPHDVQGLAALMGGRKNLIDRLDTLFTTTSAITGTHISGDITGLIGQYAHGNEPGHHTPYMYAYLGQPWKTQLYVAKILKELYNNTPDGICGNDDTGQMSAWYVLSAMGFYPVRHGDGTYIIGSPQFPKVTLQLPNGRQLHIVARGASPQNPFIQSAKWNGKPFEKNYLLHEQLLQGGVLEFEMRPQPNENRGTDPESWPPSMINEYWQNIDHKTAAHDAKN